MKHRAPNRVLDLDELETPDFQRVLVELDGILALEKGAYLHPSKRWEYPWALQQAQLRPNSRVLDAGCGGSVFPIYLAAKGHAVSAVDLDPPVGFPEAYGVAIDYFRSDLSHMPFEDATFDTAFCISVIEHLGHEGVRNALAELRRVLRPDGRLLLTTDYYEDASAKIWYEGEGDTFPVDWGFFDPTLLQQHFLQAEGFRIEGDIDIDVDWSNTRDRMRQFHGYPYTSVGLTLVRI